MFSNIKFQSNIAKYFVPSHLLIKNSLRGFAEKQKLSLYPKKAPSLASGHLTVIRNLHPNAIVNLRASVTLFPSLWNSLLEIIFPNVV